MKIQASQRINNKTFNAYEVQNNSAKVASSPQQHAYRLDGLTPAYYDINFGGSYEAANRKRFAKAQANFTPEAYKLWQQINSVAKKFNHGTITYEHVFLAVLVNLNSYMDALNEGVKKYDKETQYSLPLGFETVIGDPNIIKNKELRKKVQPIIKKQIKELSKELGKMDIPKNRFMAPRMSDSLVTDIVGLYESIREEADTNIFTDSLFLASLTISRNDKFQKTLKNFIYEVQKEVMIKPLPEEQKTHLQFYDNQADKLWKNLDLGNNVYVTYEGGNKASAKHLIESFTNLIRKPGQKYNSLNKENTEITIFNKAATFDLLKRKVEEAQKDTSKTHIFIINLADLLSTKAMQYDRGGAVIAVDECALLENKGEKDKPSNIRMVLMSDRDVFYANTSPNSGLRTYLEHYNTISIPMINADEAGKILSSKTGKAMIKLHSRKNFTTEAIERAISITNSQEGYYPEKAIKYMKGVASYYLDKNVIDAKDVEEYEIQSADMKKTGESQNEFRIIFNTGKKLDDIVGNPMTKAEAQSIVEQIQSGRKGLTRGYTTFLDNGTSYGGGRRHCAECIAGEAKIPMITINARDFALKDIDALSQNAGLSELKIKKLINSAKTQAEANKNKTAMIYIENFDNFGSNPLYGISSIYEQKAFSQLLSEMEDIRRNEGINLIVVGSTNYPEALDENIMKPYKFLDKIIIYSPQDVNDRSDILNYYIDKNGLKVGANPEMRAQTVRNAAETANYFSVVDLIYMLEKADMISAQRKKEYIDKSDFTEAYLQTTTGRVSTREQAQHDKELVTKHEAGHALTLQLMYSIAKNQNKPWRLPNQMNFVTLDPRGSYGGAMFPKDSKNDEMCFETVFSELVCDYGGSSSEKEFYGIEGSWGITQDINMATQMAQLAVTKMGMGAKTGRISISQNGLGLSDISENTRAKIDSDIQLMLTNAQIVSDKIIEAYRGFIEEFAQKYAHKVGTGDCIISSEEFNTSLQEWYKKQSDQKQNELEKLNKEIIEIIEKTKKGEAAQQ